VTEAPPSSFAALRLDRLKKLQELRAERDKLIAQDPGGARKALIEQYPTALDFAERFDCAPGAPRRWSCSRADARHVDTRDGRLVVSIRPRRARRPSPGG
jgi:hypothetical protein